MAALTLQQVRLGTGWPRGIRFLPVQPPQRKRAPTPRQIELVQLLADGYTVREAAVLLGMTYATARTHAQALRSRLKARSMNHAVAIGFREGWLS